MADSHYLSGYSYLVDVNQVNKMLRILMTFSEIYRSLSFFKPKSIISLSIREVLDVISKISHLVTCFGGHILKG